MREFRHKGVRGAIALRVAHTDGSFCEEQACADTGTAQEVQDVQDLAISMPAVVWPSRSAGHAG